MKNSAHEGQQLPEDERGFALLLTLLIVFLLTVLIFEVNFQVKTDLLAAGNFRDDLAAYYIAEAGISAGKALLEEDKETGNTSDNLTELWASPIPEYALGDGTFAGQITDESGKFNLNSLLDSQGKPILWKREQLARLFSLLEVDPDRVDPIIDWMDKNSETENHGAEDETYLAQDPPYPTKNRPLDTLEEIRFIKGITPEVYKKIAPYLTVYGDGKINVNTSDRLMLQSLANGIDDSIASRLIEGRPYDKNITDFKTKLSQAVAQTTTNNVKFDDLTVMSNVFSMEAYGSVGRTRKFIRAVWDRKEKRLLHFRVE